LIRFLKAMGQSEDRCPVCGNTHWAYGTSGKQVAAVVLTGDQVPIQLQSAMEAIWLRCRKCGYFRFHELKTIVDWLASNNQGGHDE